MNYWGIFMKFDIKVMLIICAIFACSAQAKSTLSDNIRIDSKELKYSLQYRVYTPDGMRKTDKLSTLYVTDGQWYLSAGNMVEVLDAEISSGRIKPILVVFIDSRNPDNLSENRRNLQFFCNKDYMSFYQKELLPFIDSNYPTSINRENRVIQGLSFGGYNAACFGLLAFNEFSGLSMHSPANSFMLRSLQKQYMEMEKRPLKIFLSFGNETDNRYEGRRFHDVLKDKGYQLKYKEVRFGHNWKNWAPLIDDSLIWFFATTKKLD